MKSCDTCAHWADDLCLSGGCWCLHEKAFELEDHWGDGNLCPAYKKCERGVKDEA